jgi:hypothetical protein
MNRGAPQLTERHDAGGGRIDEAKDDDGEENGGGNPNEDPDGAPKPRMHLASLGALPCALA